MYPFCFLPVDPLRTSWRRPPQRSVNTLVIAHFLHFSSWFSLSPHGASESTFSHIRSPVSNRFLFIHFLILIHCLFFPKRARLCVCLAGDGRGKLRTRHEINCFKPPRYRHSLLRVAMCLSQQAASGFDSRTN